MLYLATVNVCEWAASGAQRRAPRRTATWRVMVGPIEGARMLPGQPVSRVNAAGYRSTRLRAPNDSTGAPCQHERRWEQRFGGRAETAEPPLGGKPRLRLT